MSERINGLILCTDNLARSIRGEAWPIWHGDPASPHLGRREPASATGAEEEGSQAIANPHEALQLPIRAFAQLSLERLESVTLMAELAKIGPFERVMA